MTINNNTNTLNNISTLNTQQNSALEQIATGLIINKASDNASALAIADQLRTEQSSLSQTIDNAVSGIAMTDIAQRGFREQQNILTEIRQLTVQANNGTSNTNNREVIANQINKYLDQYENIAEQTNYNGQQLLKSTGDPSVDDLSISGEGEIVDLAAANTTSISDTLRALMTDFATNPSSRENLLNEIDQAITDLSGMEGEFGSASIALQSNVRTSMAARTSTANAESVIRDLDFTNGIANFNKTNLQAQAGYFAQAQANAVQSRVMALLSN